ncbi:MAG: hypothetical protein KC561_19340, partial [Myxococcales bacterium]|nr:hypothetical protein [Myxococcales bacterium]
MQKLGLAAVLVGLALNGAACRSVELGDETPDIPIDDPALDESTDGASDLRADRSEGETGEDSSSDLDLDTDGKDSDLELRDTNGDGATDGSVAEDEHHVHPGDQTLDEQQGLADGAGDQVSERDALREEVDQQSVGLPPWIGVTNVGEKATPAGLPALSSEISLYAARNEFEPFQVFVFADDEPRVIESAEMGPLLGASHIIGAANHVIYVEGFYDVGTPSNEEGRVGYYADPLFPIVDPYDGQARNALPLTVQEGQPRALWVDLFVPLNTPAGTYEGRLTVGVDGEDFKIPITLEVFDFALPPTSSLPTGFGTRWDSACVAHHGSYEDCGGDAGIEEYAVLYAREALDHRISLSTVVYAYRPGDAELGEDHF